MHEARVARNSYVGPGEGGGIWGGPCMLVCGHMSSRRWPEEAEGRLPKAGSWSTWFPLAGLGGG